MIVLCLGESKSSTKPSLGRSPPFAYMQARFLRLADRITSVGLESLSEPHVKHLEGKLTGRDGIARALYVTAMGRRVVVVRAFVKKTQKAPRSEIELARCNEQRRSPDDPVRKA